MLATATAPASTTQPAPTRDRYVDLLRVASLVVVVLGHWVVAGVTIVDGELDGANLLSVQPATRLLTWFCQVMPLFFIVGGFANAASWTSARRRGERYGDWVRARVVRLLRPTAAFVAVWCAVPALARVVGADPEVLRTAGRVVGFPLWFLAVYLIVVAAAPGMHALHLRFGWRVPVVLVGAVVALDVANHGFGVPMIGQANHVLVWLAVHQLGFAWRDGRIGRPGTLLAGGLTTLVLLVTVAGYPLSMVGAGEARDNNDPASLALVALGVAQLGAVLLLRPAAERWLARPRVQGAVGAANGMAMTLYLWHFTAIVVAAATLLPTGLFPAPAIGSGTWWALRPAWLAALAVVLVPLVALFSRVERRPLPRTTGANPVAVALAGGLGAVAVVLLTTGGLVARDLPLGLPLPALALLATSGVLLRRS